VPGRAGIAVDLGPPGLVAATPPMHLDRGAPGHTLLLRARHEGGGYGPAAPRAR